MAKRLHNLRRRAALAAGAILLGTVGCAFPHGSTAGDPILGNFNRPIVPTPPPERGGLGLDSPAYDAGARIGMTPPEVATPFENTSGLMSLPALTSPGLSSGARSGESGLVRRQSTNGARLPSASEPILRLPSVPGYVQSSPDSVMARPRDPISSFTSPASFNPVEPGSQFQLTSFDTPRDPSRIESIEDAHAHMQGIGARSQRTEQLPTGEWYYTCTVNRKVFEGRGRDQFEAMRKVAVQIKNER